MVFTSLKKLIQSVNESFNQKINMKFLKDNESFIRGIQSDRLNQIMFGSSSESELKISSSIDIKSAINLNWIIQEFKISDCLEIGMAFGTSTVAIVSALPENGMLYSIDPYQKTDWDSVGLLRLRELGLTKHSLIEKPSLSALPDLLSKGTKVDFIYIDGMHTFDYTLVDLFYTHLLLPRGGIFGINDTNFAAVDKALTCFLLHRNYIEVDSLLPNKWRRIQHKEKENTLSKLIDLIINIIMKTTFLGNAKVGLFGTVKSQDRFFRKVDDFEPRWNFYRNF
jgi:predicted O-methyltransferase YrrM